MLHTSERLSVLLTFWECSLEVVSDHLRLPVGNVIMDLKLTQRAKMNFLFSPNHHVDFHHWRWESQLKDQTVNSVQTCRRHNSSGADQSIFHEVAHWIIPPGSTPGCPLMPWSFKGSTFEANHLSCGNSQRSMHAFPILSPWKVHRF